MSEKLSQEDCTCERWPISGGKPHPGFEDLTLNEKVDLEAIDPDCPLHGHRLGDDPKRQ